LPDTEEPVRLRAAGRTDAGVHAPGAGRRLRRRRKRDLARSFAAERSPATRYPRPLRFRGPRRRSTRGGTRRRRRTGISCTSRRWPPRSSPDTRGTSRRPLDLSAVREGFRSWSASTTSPPSAAGVHGEVPVRTITGGGGATRTPRACGRSTWRVGGSCATWCATSWDTLLDAGKGKYPPERWREISGRGTGPPPGSPLRPRALPLARGVLTDACRALLRRQREGEIQRPFDPLHAGARGTSTPRARRRPALSSAFP